MFKAIAIWFILFNLAACGVGCAQDPPADYDYPSLHPLHLVEHDPAMTLDERLDKYARGNLDKLRPARTGDVLVLPLYKDYPVESKVLPYAVAHPFICQQGEDIEKRLQAFGNRTKLCRLIVWAPGYFPNSVPRVFRINWPINGQERALLALQPCRDAQERQQIGQAMQALLKEDEFQVGGSVATPRQAYTESPIDTHISYDAAQVVRSRGFDGRFWRDGSATSTYILWGFTSGTMVRILKTDADQKMLDAFFIRAESDGERKGDAPATRPGNG